MMEKLVEVKNLKKYFRVGRGKYLKAVDGVSFDIKRGETLGVVGESGCGKSTLARTIIRLHQPTSGDVFLKVRKQLKNDKFFTEEVNISKVGSRRLTGLRRNFQMIFQDPYASLNPRMTIGNIIAEPIDIFRKKGILVMKSNEVKDYVKYLLSTVGLSPHFINRYPHEFSGGQRQRIGIARALTLKPSLILCDEPVSALDVSIQSQILNLLEKLQNEFNLTYMFIAHDLAVVKHISDRVAVMYLGKIVEIADYKDIYFDTMHPYSKALLSAIPIPNPEKEKTRERILLTGDVPSPDRQFVGCRFRERCFLKTDICAKIEPKLEEKSPNHFSACHHWDKCRDYKL